MDVIHINTSVGIVVSFRRTTSDQFRGFLVQSRLAADDTTVVGTFEVVDQDLSELSACNPPQVRYSY